VARDENDFAASNQCGAHVRQRQCEAVVEQLHDADRVHIVSNSRLKSADLSIVRVSITGSR
jgi:hypothetical protein